MTAYEIIFSRQASVHIDNLRRYIADEASPAVANAYIDRIVEHCRSLATFPERGRARPELRADARSISYKGRTTIVYRILALTVEILAVVHAGRDLRRLLR